MYFLYLKLIAVQSVQPHGKLVLADHDHLNTKINQHIDVISYIYPACFIELLFQISQITLAGETTYNSSHIKLTY